MKSEVSRLWHSRNLTRSSWDLTRSRQDLNSNLDNSYLREHLLKPNSSCWCLLHSFIQDLKVIISLILKGLTLIPTLVTLVNPSLQIVTLKITKEINEDLIAETATAKEEDTDIPPPHWVKFDYYLLKP